MADSMFVFENKVRVKTIESKNTIGEGVNLAVRFLAFVFDSFLITSLVLFTEVFLGFAAVQAKENFLNLIIGHIIYWGIPAQMIAFVFYCSCYLTFGATPGKLAFGLRVVSSSTHGEISLAQIFVREIVGKFFSLIFFGFGFLLAFIRADGRALHDLLSSCVVVSVRQKSQPR